MSRCAPVSIIISTDGRASSLAITLKSLKRLHYKPFEVIVVHGPTQDGTRELLQDWRHEVKIGHCPRRNLSESRNIALAMATGEIVAFLDDDSIPEPEWLNRVVPVFDDPKVAAAGGFLYDHTGVDYQWRFGTVDRLGNADENWNRPAPELNFPFSARFPHAIGANSAFRLEAVLEVGGFDQQYSYYLDETDLQCRLVDADWKVVQIDGARVHHKYRPSHIRNEQKIITSWKEIIHSKIYFSLVNAHGHHGLNDAIAATQEFASGLKKGLEWHISEGRIDKSLLENFITDYEAGMRSGLSAGLREDRILYDPRCHSRRDLEFVPFPVTEPVGLRKCIVLTSRSYPPKPTGGIGKYVHQLALALCRLGHQVHVLTESDHDTVDFEEGVWVHRFRSKPHLRLERAELMKFPQHLWDYSSTMLSIVHLIAKERHVDVVISPIWDCEGCAFLLDGSFPLCTSLHTSLAFYLESHSHLRSNHKFMNEFAKPVMAMEVALLQESSMCLANSSGIVTSVEEAYNLKISESRLSTVPHGLDDLSNFTSDEVCPLPPGSVRLVWVGRLEERKGIDVFLSALDSLLEIHSNLYVDLVGDDTLLNGAGITFRNSWETSAKGKLYKYRVKFHGEVPENILRGYYRAADIVAAPSRFESFGLVFLEAMIYGVPSIGCKAGGMPEIVNDGKTGLLVEPGNVEDLCSAISRLVVDADLRRRMGTAAREIYEKCFTAEHMAYGVLNAIARPQLLTQATVQEIES